MYIQKELLKDFLDGEFDIFYILFSIIISLKKSSHHQIYNTNSFMLCCIKMWGGGFHAYL